MEPSEVAELLRDMAESIQANPSQFTYTSSIIGMQITAGGTPGGGPSIGMVVTAQGGAPGSRTTGLHIESTGGTNVQIEAMRAAESTHREGIAVALEELADTVETPAPSKGKIKAALARLEASVAPDLIIAVAQRLITTGLPGIL